MDEKPPERRPLQFGMRTLLEIIAVAAFILALMYARREPPPTPARYQSQLSGGWMLVLDTHTGQIWRISSNGDIWYPESKAPNADE